MLEKDKYATSIGGKLEVLNQKLAELGLGNSNPGKSGATEPQKERSEPGFTEANRYQKA